MGFKNILFISREFYPGEAVSEYCKSIAQFLKGKGVKSHLICFDSYASDEELDSLTVHRVPFLLHGDSIFTWGMVMNIELMRRARELIESHNFDLIHINDWITIPTGTAISRFAEIPLVVTFHSIEHERGMGYPHSFVISDLEWDGANDASAILVHSKNTNEAIKVFNLPEEKINHTYLENNWEEKIWDVYKKLGKISINSR